jgi:dTDP-4-amino-4,6-dideoxygalactose transaminase
MPPSAARAIIAPTPYDRPGPIAVARPTMPPAEAVAPYLREMDEARWYSNFGPQLSAFERRLAARFEDAPALITGVNGTQLLTLALQAMNLLPGGLVAVPSWTFVATVHAILAAGLKPWLIDVDPKTWMLDPNAVAAQRFEAPGPLVAVVPVSAFGRPVNLDAWAEFEAATGLPVLVDAAAAFDGVTSAPVPVMISLHATKSLGVGEGGLLAGPDPVMIEAVRRLTAFGFAGERESLTPATNAKLSEYAAAVGNAALDGWAATRLRYATVAQWLRMALIAAPQVKFQPGWGLSWITSTCVVGLPDGSAEHVERALRAEGVDSRRWWGLGCHRSPAFQGLPNADLPVTERLAASTIGLPYYADMTQDEVERVAHALIAALD